MTNLECSNCQVAHGPNDMFCENCGYDFVTGSLPDPDEAALVGVPPSLLPKESLPDQSSGTSAASEEESSSGGSPSTGESGNSAPESTKDLPRVVIQVVSDEEFFDEAVTGGEIEFPTSPASPQVLELVGDELHIGRTSESRAIHPDIDIAALTNDQAVSSRHAVLRVDADGNVTVTDVGSTNGTFVASVSAEPLEPGEATPIDPGTPFFVGAWTKLTILAE